MPPPKLKRSKKKPVAPKPAARKSRVPALRRSRTKAGATASLAIKKIGKPVVREVEGDPVPGIVGNIPLGHRSPDGSRPANVLMASEDVMSMDIERLVARLLIDEFRSGHRKRGAGEEWFAWVGNVGYEPSGLIFWIGLSSNAPVEMLNTIDDVIRAMGFPTARGTAPPSRSGLAPLLYLGDDGLELLRMI